MGFKSSSLLCLALLLAVSSSIHAFDITKLLGQNPDFATFNKYLTETKLAEPINSRNTITILAVSDAGLSSLSGKSQQFIKASLSTHVILDFFDEKKLMEAQGSGQLLTTLYQSSGLAMNQQGFIKVALIGEGEIAFGSAVNGAPLDVSLVKTVVSQPYNISILQVTKLIVVPGLDAQTPASSGNAQAPAAAKTPAEGAKSPVPAQNAKAPVASAKAPVPAQGAKAPAPAQKANADAPTSGAQSPSSEEVTAPSPSDVSATDSPAEAPTTTESSPSLAPGPADDETAADASTSSSSSRIMVGLVGSVMCFASLLAVM
ncbi:fasciclin-like arabinogalactan protein 14 [Cicer arietinum]|uniref:Fasciclin-like arabinogalactan protein 3 n=1 Tax=Cicer arietinum TaxID=3827 RepID=A0A1S2Y364_CICAR|nr:fasciclin-like arabinogalactan protein 3 [Cicer arietinum]